MDREYTVIGKLNKVFGLQGYLCFFTYTEEYSHLTKIHTIFLGKSMEELTVENWILSNKPRLKILGVDSPEDALKYSQLEIFVDKRFSAPLQDDEYYIRDLINISVLYEGRSIGKIKAIVNNTDIDLFEIESSVTQKIFYVPFKKTIFSKPDLKNKTIEIYSLELLQ